MAWLLKKSGGAGPDAWDFVFDGDVPGYAWVSAAASPQGAPSAGAPEAADGTLLPLAETTVTGTPGPDVFVLDAASLAAAAALAPSIVRIDSFSAAQGDTVDVSRVLQASYAPLTADTAQFRVTQDSNASASLDLNVSSSGNPFWLALAQLDGVQAGDAVNVSLDASHFAQLTSAWLV